MLRGFIFAGLLAGSLCAQPETNQVWIRSAGGASQTISTSAASPVQGSPFSASVVNESVQTLADGNRIVERSTGTTARDSQGRTRNDAALPAIGNLSAAGIPHLAFIVDPVAQMSYTLNLDEKTAHVMGARLLPNVGKAAMVSVLPAPPPPPTTTAIAGTGLVTSGVVTSAVAGGMLPLPLPASGGTAMAFRIHKEDLAKEQAETKTEDLGSQVIEGVNAHGVRSTRSIPAGEVGNEKPIDVVTEVWTSPDLKTIVMSKRSDPRTGEQTFQLTNIVQAEPDASLFTIPSDFKTEDPGSQPGNMIFYHSKE